MSDRDKLKEKIARALCPTDPDDLPRDAEGNVTTEIPAWTYYVSEAEAAISAIEASGYIIAEAVRKVSWQPNAFNVRRDENGQIFVSADGQPIMDFPPRVALELGEALVTLAASSQSVSEEAQRADTERAENSESSLTHQIPSPPQEKVNGDV